MGRHLTPAQEKRIVDLRYKEGVTNVAEIARRVGCQRHTVYRHLGAAEARSKVVNNGRPREMLQDDVDPLDDKSLIAVLRDVMTHEGQPASKISAVVAALKLREKSTQEDLVAEPITEEEHAQLLDLMRTYPQWFASFVEKSGSQLEATNGEASQEPQPVTTEGSEDSQGQKVDTEGEAVHASES